MKIEGYISPSQLTDFLKGEADRLDLYGGSNLAPDYAVKVSDLELKDFDVEYLYRCVRLTKKGT